MSDSIPDHINMDESRRVFEGLARRARKLGNNELADLLWSLEDLCRGFCEEWSEGHADE